MQNTENQNINSQKFLVISDAAKFLGISIDTLRRWDKSGIVHAVRPTGKSRYFHFTELQEVKQSPFKKRTTFSRQEMKSSADRRTRGELFLFLGKILFAVLTIVTILFLLAPEQMTKLLTPFR